MAGKRKSNLARRPWCTGDLQFILHQKWGLLRPPQRVELLPRLDQSSFEGMIETSRISERISELRDGQPTLSCSSDGSQVNENIEIYDLNFNPFIFNRSHLIAEAFTILRRQGQQDSKLVDVSIQKLVRLSSTLNQQANSLAFVGKYYQSDPLAYSAAGHFCFGQTY